MRLRFAVLLAAIAALAAVLSPALGAEPGVLVRSGDRITADIADADDTDAFALRLSEGGSLSVKLKAAKGVGLTPAFRLFDPDGDEVSLTAFLKKAGTSKPQIKKYTPSPGTTGTWLLRIEPSDAGFGGYTATFKSSQPSKVKEKGLAVGAGETVLVPFTADDGSLLTAKLKVKGAGAIPSVRVLDPAGAEVPGTEGAFTTKKTTLAAKKVPLEGGFGRYAVELTGGDEGDVSVKVVMKIKSAKIARRKVTLDPEAQLVAASPDTVRQEDTSRVVQLQGANLLSGDGIDAVVTGDGVTVGAVSVASAGRVDVTLDVAADAPFGVRDVTFFPPPLLGEPVTLADALTVHAPDPTVSGFSLASVTQGETGVVLDVQGTGFRTGGEVLVTGDGIDVTSTEVLSDTLARAHLDIDLDAPVSARNVGFRQPADGGSADAFAAGQLRVHFPQPTLDAVSPTTLRQGQTGVTLTLSGARFRDGATVTAGQGIAVSGYTRLADDTARVTVTVSGSADLGPRDVAYMQSAQAGGSSVTLSDALVVEAPVPVLDSASPASLQQGDGATTVTIDGAGFRSGGTLSFSGDGLTVGPTTFVSETRVSTTVAVSGTANVGLRDATYTQAAGKGGASGVGSGLLAIHAPTPTLTGVSPDEIEQGAIGTMTLTGTSFTPGGVVSQTGGTGVSFSNGTYLSSTSFRVDYSVTADATVSMRDLTFTQAQDAGGGEATLEDAFSVLDAGVLLTDVEPAVAVPGAGRTTLVLTGDEYNTGTTVSFAGSGVTVHSTTVDSTSRITLVASVASGASLGMRDITITPGPGGLPASTFSNRFAVAPADPTVSAFSAAALPRGVSSFDVTVSGTNFRSGATLAASGTGVTFSNVTVASDTSITARVSVTSGATLGARDVTVAHAGSLGGRSATLEDAVEIVGTLPTITSVTPSAIGRTGSGGATRSVPVRIVGTGLTAGSTLSLARSGGSGLSVESGSFQVLSATSAVATVRVTGTCTTGLWNATITLPASAGNTGTSGNNAIDVKSETTLAVNRVIDDSGSVFGGERVTIHGSGFAAGDVVDFGAQRAAGTQVIDGSTIVTTVPPPASTSTTGTTTVNVKVTSSGGGNATLSNGYTYALDETRFVVTATIPAQGATGVPTSIQSVCALLTAPCNTSTAPHGSTSGTNCYYFESGSFIQSSARGFGPQARWFVVTRSSTAALTSNQTHVLEIPTALKSIGGANMIPNRLVSTGSRDQYTFTTGSTGDSTSPTLSSITPSSGSSGRSPTTDVVLVFSEAIDPLTVTSSAITFKQGSTTIGAAYEISNDLRTVTLTPHSELAASTTYTTTVTSSVTDLSGNGFSQTAYTFTTGSSTDSTAPTIDRVIVEELPSSLDGSGTYVGSTGTSGLAFDLYLPRSGWQVEVHYSDEGGAGIDASTFSAKASVAVGGSAANAELGSNFTATSTKAVWRIPSNTTFATGDNVTFTFRIQDTASTPNTSSAATITFDVQGRNSTVNASAGGDHDPFDSRQTWLLRDDIDAYTSTYHTRTSPANQQGVTTTVSSNGVSDTEEALRLVGLASGNMTSAAATVVNGPSRGTNTIMRRLFMERVRELTRERWNIDEDGTRDDDSMDIEFLLNGEQGALTSLPTYSSSNSSNSSNAYSELSVSGSKGADSSQFSPVSTTQGQAWYDARNLREEANINVGTGSITGIYLSDVFDGNMDSFTGSSFRTLVLDVFVGIYGGTPVGEHASDDNVLAGSFDRTTSQNATHNSRYDEIMDAIDFLALLTSSTVSHEIGHSTGLVADGAPKTGLFGGCHHTNSFTEATSTSTNTSHHLDFVGQDLMAAASSVSEDTATGSDFARFNPMIRAWLRARLIYDEGL